MPAVSSVLQRGRDAAEEKDNVFEKNKNKINKTEQHFLHWFLFCENGLDVAFTRERATVT